MARSSRCSRRRRPPLASSCPISTFWARNTLNGTTSSHVRTNAEGYFRTPELPPGRYQICVAGTGYSTGCDSATIAVSRPSVVTDHLIEIRPLGNAIHGTVRLADGTTPCFWFRPVMDPVPLTAVVELQAPNGGGTVGTVGTLGTVLAGPVNANASGQFVLPFAKLQGRALLIAKCDAASAQVAVTLGAKFLPSQDVAVPNHPPAILSFDMTEGGVGIRRADAGATVQATVQTSDPDGDALHYSWADDDGRSLDLPDAPVVSWPLLNATALNTLHVQVTDGRGGFATASRTLQSGPDSLFFAGHVFNRRTKENIPGATIQLNMVPVQTDASGNFSVSVPDAPQFVLNVTKLGFALSSQILRTLAINIQVPLDAVQTPTVNGGVGGLMTEKSGLQVLFPPGAFVAEGGTLSTGSVSVEGFQYDLTQTNPIPGDLGATFNGQAVRLSTFGAFYIQPRDAAGNPLAMAAGKSASISLPIQRGQLAMAPATIPFFSYNESTGQWVEEGTLTRSGSRYFGEIKHFSAFNADTQFAGGACVKVVLDSSFTLPVTLDASYLDPNAGTFHHNGTTSQDPTIGVERMPPNTNFTLTITDSETPPTSVSVTLNSGNGLDPGQFPGGLDTDQVNFLHCNGPVQVYNNVIPAPIGSRPYFLGPVFAAPGTTITDNSAAYQAATNAGLGGNRNTLNNWKIVNGFNTNGALATGEATAIYFNNGDLKFGRDMHCRQTNTSTKAMACYVSNFGAVGTDDATSALALAKQYETSGQTAPLPGATVAMEYDPATGVQFFAYHGDGTYFPNPALDSEGNKPMPDMCMACHQGLYLGDTNVNNGANFLPFDLGSFKNDAGNTFPLDPPSATVQEQFRLMNSMVAATGPPSGVTQLIKLWYPGGVNTSGQQFKFTQGAAQLTGGMPFAGHEPLYDTVVAPVCRTCHTSIPGLEWTKFAQMSLSRGTLIQSFACGPNYLEMPHAEVPWIRFWQQSLSSTLASELNFLNGCPNH